MNLCIYLHWGRRLLSKLSKNAAAAVLQNTAPAHFEIFMLIEIFSDESLGRAITTRLSRHAWR